MVEPAVSPRLSCLSLLLSGALAAAVIWQVRLRAETPLPWAATGAAVLTAVAVFWIERRLQGFVWGVVAALLMAWHPDLRRAGAGETSDFLAQAAVVAALAGSAIGWRLAFLPCFGWRVWPAVIIGLGTCIGVAWAGTARAGVAAAAVTAGAVLPAAVLAQLLRRKSSAQTPSFLNVLTAVAAGPLAVALGLSIYRFLDATGRAEDSIWAPLIGASSGNLKPGSLSWDQARQWFWRAWWLALPVLACSLWCAAAAGWRQWQTPEPPRAWLLLLLTATLVTVTAIWPPTAETTPLPLTALLVLLAVFLIADRLGALLRRLMLPPPAEREAETALLGKDSK
jgi:hypothetical protein